MVTDWELVEFDFELSIEIGNEMFLVPEEITIVAGDTSY